jgi:hypothetical protein
MNLIKPMRPTRRGVLLALLYAGIGALVIGGVTVGLGIFNLVDAIREQQKTNTSINATILDCTDPEGDCAKENQRQIAGAVNNIGRLSVYASACAADVDPALPVRERVRVIQQCVLELVADQPPAPAVG